MSYRECCRWCKDRVVGCHSTCSDYQAYRERLAMENNFNRRTEADLHLIENIRKTKPFRF